MAAVDGGGGGGWTSLRCLPASSHRRLRRLPRVVFPPLLVLLPLCVFRVFVVVEQLRRFESSAVLERRPR